ncbi:retroviral-like aspartic protease family protein [bacterium]|nr:retroviral-like aspartic protease family protein [bacterium]
MKRFLFRPSAPIIIVRAIIEGREGSRPLKLVFDTGSSYTILPWEIVVAIGYDPAISTKRTQLTTASGLEMAPVITISKVIALGEEVKDLEVACHDIPPNAYADGLLGLNFLRNFNVFLKFKEGFIEIG